MAQQWQINDLRRYYIASRGLGLCGFTSAVLRVVSEVTARFAIISYGFPITLLVFDSTKAHAETITKYLLLIGFGLAVELGVLSIFSAIA